MMLDRLWQAAQTGAFAAGELPEPTLTEGQSLCLELLGRWLEDGEALGGWKLGLTSGRSRDAFGAGVRPFGFVLRSRIHASGVRLDRFEGAGVENELCWILGDRLAGATVSAADARAAVVGVAPAFELNQNRLAAAASPGLRVADNLSQWGLVVGETVRLAEDFDFDSLDVSLSCDGEQRERVAGRGHIDDHYQSVARLARELAAFDRGLEPGDHVITGAYTRQVIDGPGRWQGDFGPVIGSVEVSFSSSYRKRPLAP